MRPRTRLESWLWPAAIIAFGTLARVPQLFHSLNESYAFRQTQTAFVVRGYAESGIDLSATSLPVFGPDANVPMEMPVFQAIASLFTYLGLSVDVSTRLTGLVSFQASALLLYLLLRKSRDVSSALLAVALYQVLPYGLHWGAAALPDFFAAALAMAMVYFLWNWIEGRHWMWLALGSAASILAFLAKVTTAPAWCCLVLGASLLVIARKRSPFAPMRHLVALAAGPGLGVLAALAWTRYADHVKEGNQLTAFLTSGNLRDWNFGTSAQRQDFHVYLQIATRVRDEIVGGGAILIVAALIIVALRGTPSERIAFGAWSSVALFAPLVFFNLYYEHDYYLAAVYPAIVALLAMSGVVLFQRSAWLAKVPAPAAGAALVALTFATTAATPLGRESLSYFATSREPPANALAVRDATEPGDFIVMASCPWEPTFLYFAEREGVTFGGGDSGSFWTTHDVREYSALHICTENANPRDYVPPGTVTTPIEGVPGLYQLGTKP